MDPKVWREQRVLYMAWGIFGLAFGYIVAVTFLPIPTSGIEHAKTITGFLLGVGMTTIIGYYFGSSSGSAAKSEMIEKKLDEKKPNEPPKQP